MSIAVSLNSEMKKQTGNLIAFNKVRHKISLNPKHEDDVMIAKKALISNDFQASDNVL